MTATLAAGSSGSRPPLFFSSTTHSLSALRARAWWASQSMVLGAFSSAGVVESMSASSSSSRALTSTSEILPSCTALTSSRTESSPGAGISSVEPFLTPSAWSLEPPQSVTTAPVKPQSSRKISFKRWAFSLA